MTRLLLAPPNAMLVMKHMPPEHLFPTTEVADEVVFLAMKEVRFLRSNACFMLMSEFDSLP